MDPPSADEPASGRPDGSLVVLSVLFSQRPLSQSEALALQRVAYGLIRSDGSATSLAGEGLMQGVVENLRRPMLLGVVGGPAFEARFDGLHGANVVRYLLTEHAVAWLAAQTPASALN